MSKYIDMINNTIDAVLVSDTAEKDFFIEVYGEIKSTPNGYDIVVKAIKDRCTELVVQRQLINIVNMARDYVGSKLFTRVLEMRWYNVKALVALIRYINKEHGKSKVQTIKSRVSKVGKTTKTLGEYNNELSKLVGELKKEFKASITDDGKVIVINVTKTFGAMTEADKIEMLDLLLAEREAVA